jgi:hypothetical protein
MNPNTKWMLIEASKPSGLILHAASAASYASQLVNEGLLHKSAVYSIWFITKAGKRELEKEDE